MSMKNRLIIIGASGHGKVVADIAEKVGYDEIVFFDDNPELKQCGKYPVIGMCHDYRKFSGDMIVAIGNADIRQRIQEELEMVGRQIATLIHPKSVISDDVKIGDGTVVMAGAVINSAAMIGKGCIINTCASVDHDCIVGDYVHVAVGSHICGTVTVGDKTWVGAGATVSNNVDICGDCMIGAGAVVIKNITERGTYVGVPAKNKY